MLSDDDKYFGGVHRVGRGDPGALVLVPSWVFSGGLLITEEDARRQPEEVKLKQVCWAR